MSRKVTIEAQHRAVGDLFDRVLAELNKKGPYRVGYGWLPLNAFYQNYVEFGAHDEPAHDVLIRALRALPYRYYMILSFEPTRRTYFLNVVGPHRAELCPRAEGGAASADVSMREHGQAGSNRPTRRSIFGPIIVGHGA
ncbi:MAG: hypothetical protein QOF89_5622 [Acidobacteriota bacterium]|nr:hypothetical protein [Acidobacteriota bacterium]